VLAHRRMMIEEAGNAWHNQGASVSRAGWPGIRGSVQRPGLHAVRVCGHA
jgi:hypothetical protein